MYSLIILPKAQRQLKLIKKEHRSAIELALQEIKEDPLLGKPLARELNRRYSYRVGVYRIIYMFSKKDSTVTVLSALHRSIVYN